MKRQGTGNEDQPAARIRQLLSEALPPVGDAEPPRDLWPAMQRKLDQRRLPVPWLDWALACGLALFAVAFPASVPVLLYYL